jgi:hypothetical protein
MSDESEMSDEGEESKKSRAKLWRQWKGAISKTLIHVPSIAVTLGVLSLTFLHVFWERPAANTNTILNSLQFAAQLHTSFILMSLSAMVLHYVHHCLSSQAGAPLGLLSSNFQLHSISYVFSLEFRSLSFRYIGIFLCVFGLAMLSGPSSAITMLPRLQFWSLDNLWVVEGNMDFYVYIAANETTLYPTTLTSTNAPPQCSGANASLLDECPSSGIRNWMQHDELFIIYGCCPYSINESTEENFLRYMVGQTSDVFQGDQGIYLTSTLSNFLGSALVSYNSVLREIGSSYSSLGYNGYSTIQAADSSLLARYDLSFRAAGKEVATRKPVVEVECAGYPQNTTSLGLPHSQMAWPPWTTDPIFSTQWNISSSDYSSLFIDLESNIVNSSWIDIDQFGDIRPSLGALFATPSIISAPVVGGQSNNNSLYTCTIDARWMPTKAFWDSSSGAGAVFDSNPNPNAAIDVNSGLYPTTLPAAYIDQSWADILNVPWIDSITDPVPTNRTILDTIGQKCVDKNTFFNSTSGILSSTSSKQTLLSCFEVALSIYIADAMARLQDSTPIYFVAEGHLDPSDSDFPSDVFYVQNLFASDLGSTIMNFNGSYGYGQVTGISKADFADTSRFLEMYMPASRWGYGYGFQDSRLIYLGTVVLLLHVLLCVVYLLWMLGFGKFKRGEWGSIGELVLMAMRSGTVMKSSGVEMISKKRWQDKYVIEEVEESIEEGETTGRESRSYIVLRKISDRDGKQSDSSDVTNSSLNY